MRAAIGAARGAQREWAAKTPVERGELVRELALALRARREEAAELVAAETGKSMELALGETDAAVEMGFFVAGEGRRLYGRTTTSAMPNRTVLTTRRPVGIAALIVSFNTPLPNYAWKAFPAVFCGNAAVLKPSEHTPLSASFFAGLCGDVLPPGVLNVVHGLGPETGPPLVESPEVDLVSFTGSAETGRAIQERAGRRLAKVCLELGGKNALVVCDDADLDRAADWSLASAFSNAGQRCAAASRIVVFDAVYEEFRDRFVAGARTYETGPVISEESLERVVRLLKDAPVLAGGERLDRPGWWLAPTVLEGVAPDAELSCTELFGPVTILYRVRDLDEAIALVNDSPYGLTSAIHTGEPASRHAVRRRGRGRGGRRQRGHARERAAHGLRRREAVGHRLARGRCRGPRRLHGVEVREPHRGSDEDVSHVTLASRVRARAWYRRGGHTFGAVPGTGHVESGRAG